MEPVYGRVAGIDVHKAMLAVVVADAGSPEGGVERGKFGTTRRELQELADWLSQRQVVEVVMESTAQYWRPVWLALEERFVLHLAQARSTTAPRGRKWDFVDAERLVRRLLSGDLTLSYVPDAEQRRWRLLTRTRVQLSRQMVRLRNQMEGLLEEGQIKLSCVVSDLLGASGRRILEALAWGETDAQKLAALGHEQLKASKQELQEALNGQLHPLHRTLLRLYLEELDLLERHRARLESELSEALKTHREAVARLCELPGVNVNSAQEIIAELGPRAEAFPSAPQVASWVGVCPGRQESAGHSRSNRSPKGNRPMRRLLNQCAWAAVRTKGSYFQRLFWRLVPRLGEKKALWAIAHRLLRLIWKILHQGIRYQERGDVTLNPALRLRRRRRLVRALRNLGYEVVLTPVPEASAA